MRITFTVILFVLSSIFSVASAQTWQWGRGNTGSGMDGWAVATDPSGNVFVAGINFGISPVTLGTVTVPDAGAGSYQCIIAKYDANGNILWASGTQNGDAYLFSIAADQSGNSFLFGSFKSASLQIGGHTLYNAASPVSRYFLVKFDPGGNVLWAVNDGNAQSTYVTLGGISVVLGTGAVTTDLSGNVYITANFHQPLISIATHTLVNADPSGLTNDILLAKYDPAGNLVWVKSAGGAGNDEAYGITVTPAGDVYIAGVFGSPTLAFGSSVINNASGQKVAFIARYDGSGNPSWACSSGGTGGEYACGLASDISNNVYLTGGLKDNSIAFSGTAITNPDTIPVLYLVKFDPANNVSWYKTIGSALDTGLGAWGYSIAVSQCGLVWVSGCMNNDIMIDGHLLSCPPLSADPIFMAAYSASGTYAGSVAMQSGGDDQNGIACDGSGNVFMCSDYKTYPFSIGNDTFPSPSGTAGELLFVGKYAASDSLAKNPVCTKTDICLSTFITLNAPPGYGNYIWNDGSRGVTKTTSDTGIFWVTGFDSCTIPTVDTFKVTAPSKNARCTKTDLCLNNFITLQAHTGFSNYLWNDGSTGYSRTVGDTGVFWVMGYDSCASAIIDTFKVTAACDCQKSLFVPNAFTPNGDGKDDVFYPRCGPNVKKIKTFRVYNRWGELLFERENLDPNDAVNSWDGTYNGNLPLPDVYVWVVDAICDNDNTVNKKGSVTIIR